MLLSKLGELQDKIFIDVYASCRLTINTAMTWKWYQQSFVLGFTQMLYSAKEEESAQHSTLKKLGKWTYILHL